MNTGGGDTVFTYETERDILVGSLVSIPLRNRFVKGMVIKKVSKPSFNTKPIKKVLSEEPVLTKTQLELAQKIADYYFCNLADAISGILSFDFGKKRRITEKPTANDQQLQTKFKLTEKQQEIYNKIKKGKPSSKYLLFGVTGSGKTEIYLQLVADALEKGLGSIILVPEISLTPQTAKRFTERFGDTVAIWHSQLKETEKYHTWQRIKSGQAKIVLGARSAIFSPLESLGYIIIDEEHESSYKQDQTPRYETGRIAAWLADLTGAKVVSGSATPKIESFYKTAKKEVELCEMPQRIIQNEMPPVKIVDLRDEFKKGNRSIISDDLSEAITETLEAKKQVILFVNRRGASTFVVCRDCGFVEECPKCEVPLTYHPSEGQVLKCHHCDYRKTAPVICPECGSHAIKFFGLGTQRAEIEVKKSFPNARVARMDRDTTRKRGSHEQIYEDFSAGDFDILIGTQIIAKGWDLPGVSLVGIISADTMLNLPDFRSAERTFSLLTQVAGRTGRGYHPGRVITQTYNPESYAVKAAANHDYRSFYEQEISERKKYLYPPFSELIKLTYSSADSQKAEIEAGRLVDILTESLASDPKQLPQNQIGAQILGPSTAFIERIAGRYRWQIVIKLPINADPAAQEDNRERIFGILKDNLKSGWTIDINPESLL